MYKEEYKYSYKQAFGQQAGVPLARVVEGSSLRLTEGITAIIDTFRRSPKGVAGINRRVGTV